ncbi:hypothetical protein FA15DRAFT_158380 [Coprinopsis marcescibilis]|uniref:Uncharacterized protein n=1 Tax=Coprinopsis marcescibilis TaxID=230819 RepID=A0A5C3L3H4_COPMA|nr:hypothetical protein FA15DRAFT_158380 [Coprinopsis marcescibilis]
MPPRPAIKARESRPISAIYIGSSPNVVGSINAHVPQTPPPSSSASNNNNDNNDNGATAGLPDLPEPPSPSSSIGSQGSGLPSPPATNSTGSGSTGDPGSIAIRRPLSFASDSSASTSSSRRTIDMKRNTSGSNTDTRQPQQSQQHEPQTPHRNDDEYDDNYDDNENDGDDTARLDRLGRHAKSSSENSLALQRVKNLTQRNRLAIDKLTRMASPSPSNQGRSTGSRSPVPSHTGSSTSSSRLRQVRTISSHPVTQERGASGSETERESTSQTYSSSHSHSSSTSSSARRPITPPSGNNNVALAGASSPYSRLRHISAPDSPQKARLINAASGSSNSSNSPSNRRRKRASMATMTAVHYEDEDDGDIGGESRFSTATGIERDQAREQRDTVRDITQSALAAVASSRRSPLGTRKRAALPREFREVGADSETHSVSEARTRRSEDNDVRSRLTLEPVTPYRSGVGRSATLREVGRSGPPSSRWASEDYRRATATTPVTPFIPATEGKRERRQTLRGGSAESALYSPGGRTLLSEGLRAAGLSFKRDDLRTANGDVFRERRIDWSPQETEDKGKRRFFATTSRAATSMADYRNIDRQEENEDDRRSRTFRNHRSTYSLSENPDRDSPLMRRNRDLSLTRTEREQLELDRATVSSATANTQAPSTAVPRHLHDRHSTASPFGTKRQSTTPAPGASSDHTRLLFESLASFESNIAKLPPFPVTSLGKLPAAAELLKHAQSVVLTTERINTLMKQGTNRALEEQINAEVDGDESTPAREMLDVWRQVGGEYREGLRASDELVRALTSFIMDVGATMRRLSPGSGASDYGSPALHARSISLDEEGLRQQQRLSEVEVVPSGRKSVDPRRSWEPALREREREREREETLRKLAGGSGRDSSLALARASPALMAIRDRDRNVYDTPSPLSNSNKPLPSVVPGGSDSRPQPLRRLFSPREQREWDMDEQAAEANRVASGSGLRHSDSQRTVQVNDAEPSPTPAQRMSHNRSRTATPLDLPRPLPTLPSEQTRRTSAGTPSGSATKATTTPVTATNASVERNRSVRDRNHERRKPSVASIVTVRGSGPSFPGLTAHSSATTGLTPHTVSNSPETASPMTLRSDSNKSARSTVTFSRPTGNSVSAALTGIQQEEERKRTSSNDPSSSSGASASDNSPAVRKVELEVQKQPRKLAAIAMVKAKSGTGSASASASESDREAKRRLTVGLGVRASPSPRVARMSLDGEGENAGTIFSKGSTSHAADRSAAASTVLPRTGQRRRTVTDIFPRE